MFVLQAARAPEWRDFEPGIRLQLRFGPAEALMFGRRHARLLMRADSRRDPEFVFVAGILIWAVLAWEGVGAAPETEGASETGETSAEEIPAAPLNADTLSTFLVQRPDIFDALNATYIEEVLEAQDEKKGSGPSPNGTSTAGPDTATPAPNPAPPVRTRSTSRSAKRVKGSGRSSRGAAGS